ncbi:MAG: N-6 DNA methylase [Coleofasciculus sp. G3-WIS-01]|uniref:N-6 DNA methylase n=1 Tax=Coleofasciculus sp. G3-WIS-01 TaxID=3069528 RepID=UPI003301290C
MESCVVICRTQKPQERRGKILLIDAVKEVARVQAQSFLKPEHQKRILAAYRGFRDEEGFAKVVTVEQVSQQDYSLSIPLYVRRVLENGMETDKRSLKELWSDWQESGREFWRQMDEVVEMLDQMM